MAAEETERYGIFFDEDDARAVERRLTGDGYRVRVGRERFAGEDDDTDHPWMVWTDAPAIVLELLVEEHEGWLEEDSAPSGPLTGPASPGLPLPDAPRRTHRDG